MAILAERPQTRDAAQGSRTERRAPSGSLASAFVLLEDYVRRQPDLTLGELRAVLLGTGFTWTPDGRLALSPARARLAAELDEWVERYGWDARGADYLHRRIEP